MIIKENYMLLFILILQIIQIIPIFVFTVLWKKKYDKSHYYEEKVSKELENIKQELDQVNYRLKQSVHSGADCIPAEKTLAIQSEKSGQTSEMKHIPFSQQEAINPESKESRNNEQNDLEKSVLQFINQHIEENNLGLDKSPYSFEGKIGIKNPQASSAGRDIIVFDKQEKGMVGLIKDTRNEQYYAIPLSNYYIKSIVLGSSFKYLFKLRDTEGNGITNQTVSLVRVAKLARLKYSDEKKGYRLCEDGMGEIIVKLEGMS